MPDYIPLNYDTPNTEYFERIRGLGSAWFLDSGKPDSDRGRFDILVAQPAYIIRSENGNTHVDILDVHYSTSSIKQVTPDTNPFDLLNTLYKESAQQPDITLTDIPFCGGLLGYFGYDLGRTLENLPTTSKKEIKLPDMEIGFYPWALIIDHEKASATLVACNEMSDTDLNKIASILQQPSDTRSSPFEIKQAFSSNLSEANYHQKLGKISEYIHAGDCYQVNFSQRFTAPCLGDPWNAYKKLRVIAPTQFAAYTDTKNNGGILSLSPERFITCDSQGNVTTQPIKGTRPRSDDPIKDQQLAAELLASQKDRAENVMIVDLLRNDISKTCEPGSVKVPKLFDVEHYKNVHHLVSTVTGKLQSSKTPVDLLKQSFPGGSITGAPKIRAMEIIEELEPHRRHIYCGSIGYISVCGHMDTSITIRTMLVEDNQIYCWAGGGIVADSQSDDEYQETFDKVNNLLEALQQS